MTSVGVVGLGVIGRAVCGALDAGIEGLALAGATARDRTRGEAFLRTLSAPPPYLPLDQLIGAADLLVEASTQAHLAEWAPAALGAGKDLMVLSCGALVDRAEGAALAGAPGAGRRAPARRPGRRGRVKAAGL